MNNDTLIRKLQKLADHLYSLDSDSGEAHLISEALMILRMRESSKRGYCAMEHRGYMRCDGTEAQPKREVVSPYQDYTWEDIAMLVQENKSLKERESVGEPIPDNEEVRAVLTWAHNVVMCCENLPENTKEPYAIQVFYLKHLKDSVEKLRTATSNRVLGYFREAKKTVKAQVENERQAEAILEAVCKEFNDNYLEDKWDDMAHGSITKALTRQAMTKALLKLWSLRASNKSKDGEMK